MTTTIQANQQQGRIEAHDDNITVGKLDYELKDSKMYITHTNTFEGHEGKGVAQTLVEAAIAESKKQGIKIVPICSYAKVYFERHTDMQYVLA